MKKNLILFSLLFASLLVAQKRIEVGAGKSFENITTAIQSASDKDSIIVFEGIYHEKTIIIDKKIVLIGINNPVIDGQQKNELISITSDSVSIEGFRIINSAYSSLREPCAIKIYSKQDIVIKNNILENNCFGIYIQKGKRCSILNNNIRAYETKDFLLGNGIHCWQSEDLHIEGNKIEGHRDGIYFEFVQHSLIKENHSLNNKRYGLHFMFSHNDRYIGNQFKNNGAGVAVMYSKNVEMVENKFEKNTGDASYGLLLKEISHSRIYKNRFSENTTAIFMEGASACKLEENSFENNGWALKIQASCYENEITHNKFNGNSFDASTNGSLVLNSFNANYWDRYKGYDLDKDGFGDVPYHPLSLFSVMVERIPATMFLFRSFMVNLLDLSEKLLPSITPDNFRDESPLMKPYHHDRDKKPK